MSGRKILTVGLVVGIGILNGYYVFEPTFREHAQQKKPLDLSQQVLNQQNKAESSESAGKDTVGDAESRRTS